MLLSLKNVLDDTLQIFNFIRSSPSSINVFTIPCDEMENASSLSATFQSTMIRQGTAWYKLK